MAAGQAAQRPLIMVPGIFHHHQRLGAKRKKAWKFCDRVGALPNRHHLFETLGVAFVGGEPFVEIGLFRRCERPLGNPQAPGGCLFLLFGEAVVVVLRDHGCSLIRRAIKTSAREICLSTVRR
nr:hypothetical protein [Sphingopyxis sp. OAS728]